MTDDKLSPAQRIAQEIGVELSPRREAALARHVEDQSYKRFAEGNEFAATEKYKNNLRTSMLKDLKAGSPALDHLAEQHAREDEVGSPRDRFTRQIKEERAASDNKGEEKGRG